MTPTLSDLHPTKQAHLTALRYFSLGYQLIPADEFLAELEAAEVDVVVDVRETPWSRKRGFSRSQLCTALESSGIEYIHARFAGNPKELRRDLSAHEECLRRYSEYLDSKPEILDQLTNLLLGLDPGAHVCFVCYERHPDDCHRSILFDQWRTALGQHLPLTHLCPDGAPRFVRG